MTIPKYLTVDPRENDRKERIAMTLACSELLSRLVTFHPKIVAHLQSLPMAQKVEKDG